MIKSLKLVNFRNFHETKSFYYANQEEKNGTIRITLNSSNSLYMKCSAGIYNKYYNTYYQNMMYREEKARGFEYIESHFMPGCFEIEIDKNDNIRPVKGRNSKQRIDGTVSLIDSYVVYQRHFDDFKAYNRR